MDHPPRLRTRRLLLLLPLTWPGVLYGLWQRRQAIWLSLPRPALGLVAALGLGIGSYGLWASLQPRPPLSRLDQALTIPPVPQSAIMMSLIRWTECARSISSDTKVIGDCWETVRDFTAPRAWTQLEPFYTHQLERQQQRRVQITHPQVMPLDASNTYQVEWQETAVDLSGDIVEHESGRWQALLHVATFSDKTAHARLNLRFNHHNYRNLLGIAVDDIQWAQRPPQSVRSENHTSSVHATTKPIMPRALSTLVSP